MTPKPIIRSGKFPVYELLDDGNVKVDSGAQWSMLVPQASHVTAHVADEPERGVLPGVKRATCACGWHGPWTNRTQRLQFPGDSELLAYTWTKHVLESTAGAGIVVTVHVQ